MYLYEYIYLINIYFFILITKSLKIATKKILKNKFTRRHDRHTLQRNNFDRFFNKIIKKRWRNNFITVYPLIYNTPSSGIIYKMTFLHDSGHIK